MEFSLCTVIVFAAIEWLAVGGSFCLRIHSFKGFVPLDASRSPTGTEQIIPVVERPVAECGADVPAIYISPDALRLF
jgi:hypothetical protein